MDKECLQWVLLLQRESQLRWYETPGRKTEQTAWTKFARPARRATTASTLDTPIARALYPHIRRPVSSSLASTLRPSHINPSQCLPVQTYARPCPNFFSSVSAY